MKNGKLYRMPMTWFEHITIPLTRLLRWCINRLHILISRVVGSKYYI